MVRIHIRLNFEDETSHALIVPVERDLGILAMAFVRPRCRCEFLEHSKQLADPEMAQRRAEHDRRHMPFQEGLLVDIRQHFLRHLRAFFQLLQRTWIDLVAHRVEIDTRRLARRQTFISGLFRIVQKLTRAQIGHATNPLT